MEAFLHKRTLAIFWLVLVVHCVFQYFQLPYRAVTKPLLVPLLLLYLMLHDPVIGKPFGKFIFYIGLFMAFFGDVLLILINDTFFLAGMIAFMLMNLCYSVSFIRLAGNRVRSPVSIAASLAFMAAIGFALFRFLSSDLGEYTLPVMAYMVTVAILVTAAVNIAGDPRYRVIAVRYLIPGALVFTIENALVALNWFHFGANKDLYILVMLAYGTAQYLMALGVLKAYPTERY